MINNVTLFVVDIKQIVAKMIAAVTLADKIECGIKFCFRERGLSK
jgi:hypothetical protein